MQLDKLAPTAVFGQSSERADRARRATRSEIMSRIRSKNTGPEMKVRKALHRAGHRFRIHRADLPGCPDLLFPRYRLALFVNGCFWHWHGCKRSRMPKSNVKYWTAKIKGNVDRDRHVCAQLERLGWHWRVIWECEIAYGVERLLQELGNDAFPSEIARI